MRIFNRTGAAFAAALLALTAGADAPASAQTYPNGQIRLIVPVPAGGVTDTIVRLTADNGLVGWGECTSGPDVASIEQAVRSAAPFVLGRDPWQSEAIARDFFRTGLWDHRQQTGNFAYAGIDQALWDLCGKECGQPLYRLK